MTVVEKPRFKKKWSMLALSHRGIKALPFPGRNKTRWVVVRPNGRKLTVFYEGKPSRQALELMHSLKKEIVLWMEFDREGVFFIQNVYFGQISVYNSQNVPVIWKHYHRGMGDSVDLAKSFPRP
jgi:hypothetical protein